MTRRTGESGIASTPHVSDIQVFPSGPDGTDDAATLTLLVGLMTPQSRGELRLASRDPHVAADVDPGYLRHPDDLARLVAGVELAQHLADQPALRNHLATTESPPPWVPPT
jgi:choline dehydrogenase-like flavoprotein